MADEERPCWSLPIDETLRRLGSAPTGLSDAEARRRLGKVTLTLQGKGDGGLRAVMGLLLSQFKSPIVLILVFAAALSAFLHDPADSSIILAIVLASAGLGFWQERGAKGAVEKLLAMVRVNATVLRDGTPREVPAAEVQRQDGDTAKDVAAEHPGIVREMRELGRALVQVSHAEATGGPPTLREGGSAALALRK